MNARWTITLALLLGCGDPGDVSTPDGSSGALTLRVPRMFPRPRVPQNNPFTTAKAELGRRLFYDRKLSQNQTQSCGSCHRQSLAFTDGRAHAVGSTGSVHHRSAMALTNVAWYSAYTWADPLITSLEQQALLPIFSENPVELGFAGREDQLLERIRTDALYPSMFQSAFPDRAGSITIETIAHALATFQRALISGNSPYDRYVNGERTALSPAARRGMDLFFGERLECYHCHGGFNFSDAVTFEGLMFDETSFHNTALYNIDGRGAYPSTDTGLEAVTHRPEDMGRFRAPSLRNIALTAPYMHDGSVATLEDALQHYASGGRTIASELPNAGVGNLSPLRDGQLNGFALSPVERDDLVQFLRALTDTQFVTDPRFSDPFGNER
jgi:cytochrome c peroxidase